VSRCTVLAHREAVQHRVAASALALALLAAPLASQTTHASCSATAGSLTPASWSATAGPSGASAPSSASSNSGPSLTVVADIPLPGAAKRFDYQSLDTTTGRLYISHMRGDRLDVFDTRAGKLIASLEGFPGATGVWSVPSLHHVYVSVTGRHEVAVVDDRTLKVLARVSGADFPDGIAYAPAENRIFVSDENGSADLVIDGASNAKAGLIELGGEAGNTHYDAPSHCILVAVQTKNDLVAIDPASQRIVARYPMSCDHPHGFLIDEPHRLAFVTCEGDSRLLVVDLRSMRTTATFRVAEGPDVLAFDPALRRLYVASESGSLAAFDERDWTLTPRGEYHAAHSHTVAVDPSTHRVYLPLQDVGGKPVLRILKPSADQDPTWREATPHPPRVAGLRPAGPGRALRQSRELRRRPTCFSRARAGPGGV
jgi:DNA-binding beta-propeller fold protein YncE